MSLTGFVTGCFLVALILCFMMNIYDLTDAQITMAGIGSLLSGMAAMTAAIAAIIGLNRWRSEQKWKNDRDLAVELLQNFNTTVRWFQLEVSNYPRNQVRPGTGEDKEAFLKVLSDFHRSQINAIKLIEDNFNTTALKVNILWGVDLRMISDSISEYIGYFRRVYNLREGAYDHSKEADVRGRYSAKYTEVATNLNIRVSSDGDFYSKFDEHRNFLEKVIRSKKLR